MATVNSLEIEIKSSANSATKALESLRNTLTNLRSACQNGAGLKEVASALERVNKATGGISGMMKNTKEAISQTAVSSAEASKTTQDLLNTLQDLVKSTGSLSSALTDSKKATDAQNAELKEANEQAKKAAFSFKNLLKQAARVGLYRAIRFAFKQISSAIKEGVTALYEYSKANDGVFSGMMDSLKSANTQLKNQIGSMISEVISAYYPMILGMINALIKAANIMSQVFAKLRGQNSWYKANEIAASWKESTKAAKEYKTQTLGIDELNILNKDTDSGGAGSSGSNVDAYEYTKEFTIPEGLQKALTWLHDNLNVIKELTIAIGLGIAGWMLSSLFTESLAVVAGIAVTILGLVLLIAGTIDAWNNGTSIKTLTEQLIGTGIIVGGLALLFGAVGAAIGLLVGGVAMLVTGFREFIKTGEMTNTTLATIEGGIFAVGGGLAILLGPIALVVAAVVGAVTLIAAKADEIRENINMAFNFIIWELQQLIDKIREKVGKGSIIAGVLSMVQNGIKLLKGILITAVNTIEGLFNGIVTFIKGVFSLDFKTALSGIGKIIQTIVNGVIDLVEGAINAIIRLINMIGWDVPEWVPVIGGSSWHPSIPEVTIPWRMSAFATGGFPETGQLFLANEAGPEMVGNIGNRTAVANTEQIVEGIEAGVASAVSSVLAPYLAQIANNTRETANKNFSVNIGDRDIARANNRGQKALGRTIVSTT